MAKYVCVTKCFYQDRLYEVGEKLTLDSGNPPRHFEKVTDAIPIVSKKAEPEQEPETEDEVTIEKLRAECEKLGIACDRRWGKTKLEHTLIIRKRDGSIENVDK